MSVQGPNNNPFIGKQSYGIEKKELEALHAELKENKDVNFSDKDLADIDKAIMNGDLGTYLENLGDAMRGALGLSLSNKIGAADATQDTEEAKRIAKEAELNNDCDLQKVLQYIQLAAPSYKRFENDVVTNTIENPTFNGVLLADNLMFDEGFKGFTNVLDGFFA